MTSISYWDLTKFPYFAETTETRDRGVKSRPKDRVTLRITLIPSKFPSSCWKNIRTCNGEQVCTLHPLSVAAILLVQSSSIIRLVPESCSRSKFSFGFPPMCTELAGISFNLLWTRKKKTRPGTSSTLGNWPTVFWMQYFDCIAARPAQPSQSEPPGHRT